MGRLLLLDLAGAEVVDGGLLERAMSGGGGCWGSWQTKAAPALTLGFCCPEALSPCGVSSTLPNWPIPVEIVPDSTSDLYNFQVSPMPSTSEGSCFWGLAFLLGSKEGFPEGEKTLRTPLGTELTGGLERRGKRWEEVRLQGSRG